VIQLYSSNVARLCAIKGLNQQTLFLKMAAAIRRRDERAQNLFTYEERRVLRTEMYILYTTVSRAAPGVGLD
jgi:hypothetical protein